MEKKILTIIVFLLVMLGCKEVELKEENSTKKRENMITPFDQPPAWAKEVIWYEIAVERFYNGDPTNDQTAADIVGTYPGFVPKDWSITSWTQDWYQEDAYLENSTKQKDFYGNTLPTFIQKAQLRRYGGDLQGVLDKMDYLDSLGVTAIYFRPLNDAPSLHKYDARNWRHIDRNFGPDPKKDQTIMALETPDDPTTWQWTTADQLFLKVIDEFHKRKIKVILDYSWNHTGAEFWAWKDLVQHQEQSKYKDWYWVEQFDDPNTPENEFKYHGWSGVHELPEIKETQKQDLSKSVQSFEGNIYSNAVKQHIFSIAKRWLDPNGDGDPSDGIDGYRLDVAAETPLGFWKDFRKEVRNINPDAYLLGEIWWEAWPDKLLDPKPFLQGDVFDAVMNYRWYRATRHFFNASPDILPVAKFVDSLQEFRVPLKQQNAQAMMNLNGSFDTPRVLTSLFNKNAYKYNCKPTDDPEYKIHKPDTTTYETLRLLLAHQYTYIGAPHIYAGAEMGMWGGDDPSCRKPLIWPEFIFETEKIHPLGLEKPVDEVQFNQELFGYYQKLIALRKENPILVNGDIDYIKLAHSDGVLAYSRFDEKNEVLTVFNTTSVTKNVAVPCKFSDEYNDVLNGLKVLRKDNQLVIAIPARTAVVLKNSGE